MTKRQCKPMRKFSVRMWNDEDPLGSETVETVKAIDTNDAELTASLEWPNFDHYDAGEEDE